MRVIKEIYLDIDDTLTDFTHSAFKLFGGVGESVWDWFHPRHGFDIVSAVNAALGLAYTKQNFWNKIPYSLWAEQKLVTPWLLRESATLVGAKNVYLATSPTLCPLSAGGKLEWINNTAPGWIRRQYFITPRKYQLAGPGRLLVDDCLENVNQWRAHGGLAILISKPWNKGEEGLRLDERYAQADFRDIIRL